MPGWEITFCRSVFPQGKLAGRLRVLRPAGGGLPEELRRAAEALGAETGAWGDRPALGAPPEAILARSGELGLSAGLRGALEALARRRARTRFEMPLAGGRTLRLGDPPAVMGIINATPDSFSDGGRHLDPGRALEAAMEMVEAGVDVIDVGGESTRPGAAPVDAGEERRRVEPVIRRIRGSSSVALSIDTTKAEVARAALDLGADVINDVSALRDDPAMAALARESGAPVVLMHRRGTPRDMQVDPRYDDCPREVYQFLAERLRELEGLGLDPEKVVIDPGIGFGKRVEHNLMLLRDLDELRSLGRPVLVGASRKSFMGKVLGTPRRGEPPVESREAATLAAHAAAIAAGAAAVRVHDVPLHRDLIRVLRAISLGARGEA